MRDHLSSSNAHQHIRLVSVTQPTVKMTQYGRKVDFMAIFERIINVPTGLQSENLKEVGLIRRATSTLLAVDSFHNRILLSSHDPWKKPERWLKSGQREYRNKAWWSWASWGWRKANMRIATRELLDTSVQADCETQTIHGAETDSGDPGNYLLKGNSVRISKRQLLYSSTRPSQAVPAESAYSM